MKSMPSQTPHAKARPFAASFRCGVFSLAITAMLHGGSAHAESPGEAVTEGARQSQRFEWRRMLTVDPDEERREAVRRRLSEEERDRLRRDIRDAARDGYPKAPQRRSRNDKGRKSR